MQGVVTAADRRELEELDAKIERAIETVVAHADSIDTEQARSVAETAKRWAQHYQRNPPPALDPSALAEIRKIILEGFEAQETIGDRPLDILDDLLVRAEAIRHLFRDILDSDSGVDVDDARLALQRLQEWLPGVSQKELARLVGRSVRQVQRWLKGGGVSPDRLRLVVRLVAVLRHGWTPQGVVAWFDRPRRDLGGHKPIDLLDDPFFELDLLEAARRGRAQHGS